MFDNDRWPRVAVRVIEHARMIFVVDRPGLDEQFRLELQGLDRARMTVTVAEFNDIVRQCGTAYKTFD